ncbi:hypothetical protein C8N32_101250 [Rhodovulum imhoffii]|uniref:histidine kinase n=1 Tax=Rhodovulum imhoffii TaxID=365340 RepID=A0A2T5BWQ0_9RHOB|nr:PAS-domain containing protein [Rhodovulum imhoffii]MBK5933294.1 hybrid sensor histidine kinase/response regulator [Rhodovulum imhoffii]PTN04052.1 hypothetical protein C8N32_101250 [Rhodovulum imhoffii]
MTDPSEPPEVRLERLEKIIDALIRRANRQDDIGPAAFRAFQSAIELQERVEAQTRDLERAETELESVRYERERTRRSLVDALSSMAEGFALFMDGKLHVTNGFMANLLPDRAEDFVPGLGVSGFFKLIAESNAFTSADRNLREVGARLSRQNMQEDMKVVVELSGDRWYQLNAQHTSGENLVLLMTEITQLVRRNRQEKETLIDLQEDYLRAVFQHMSPGVCTISAQGQILLLNFQFHELLGIPPADLKPGMRMGKMIDLLKMRGLLSASDEFRLSVWRNELRTRGQVRRRIRPGAGKVLEVRATRLPGGGFVVEVRDVTLEVRTTEMLEERVKERTVELTMANERLRMEYREKARVEEELRIARDRAEAAISSKTRFLAAASHDLLQPINAAQLLISTLRETTRQSAFHPMVERLFGAFGSVEQLLRSLLDISRLESADADAVSIEPIRLDTLMSGIQGDQALMAEQKNIRFDVVLSSAVVISDSIYLLRSIQNLVVNAIQYTPPGGRVLVGCRRKGKEVELQVWDTGIGIARADQLRIFEEFTRGEGAGLSAGVGLGLSVVDRACRLLGHKLFVRSAPGVGSMFSITMGVAEDAPRRGEPPRALTQSEDLRLDHIVLVIENDEDVLYSTTKWLEQAGASVQPARSVREAIEFVNDMGMPPDIILADYQLDQGETGVEAISCVRALTNAHVPAIMITANRSESLREAGLLNDVSVMAKPVKMARLKQLIDWKIKMKGRRRLGGTDKSRQ